MPPSPPDTPEEPYSHSYKCLKTYWNQVLGRWRHWDLLLSELSGGMVFQQSSVPRKLAAKLQGFWWWESIWGYRYIRCCGFGAGDVWGHWCSKNHSWCRNCWVKRKDPESKADMITWTCGVPCGHHNAWWGRQPSSSGPSTVPWFTKGLPWTPSCQFWRHLNNEFCLRLKTSKFHL